MTILITGASRGIGKFLFEKFFKPGESGVGVYGTYNMTRPDADEASFLTKVDVTNYTDVLNWIAKIKDKITRAVLINCAGINYNSFSHKADVGSWKRVIDVNLIGTFNVIRAVLPIMREEGYGRIINCSSAVAQTRVPGASAYAASKAGLWGLVKSVSVENAMKGITINNLNLGYFDIGMIAEVLPEFQESLRKNIPVGKFGDPENIFRAVKFLIETDYINGASVDVNGGLF